VIFPPSPSTQGLQDITESPSPAQSQSRLARSLRGSFRNSTRRSPSIVNALQRRFTTSGRKKLQVVHEDLIDDFHIITDDDLLAPPLPPATIHLAGAPHGISTLDQKSIPKLQLQAVNTELIQPSEPASANTQLSVQRTVASETSGPSELGDITRHFPPPPTHIPSPNTGNCYIT